MNRLCSIGLLLAWILPAGVSCGSSQEGQKIYFVAIGEMESVRLDTLQAYYKQRYDLTIEVLPPILGPHLDVVGQDALLRAGGGNLEESHRPLFARIDAPAASVRGRAVLADRSIGGCEPRSR